MCCGVGDITQSTLSLPLLLLHLFSSLFLHLLSPSYVPSVLLPDPPYVPILHFSRYSLSPFLTSLLPIPSSFSLPFSSLSLLLSAPPPPLSLSPLHSLPTLLFLRSLFPFPPFPFSPPLSPPPTHPRERAPRAPERASDNKDEARRDAKQSPRTRVGGARRRGLHG